MASTFYHKEALLTFSGFEQINYLKKEVVGLGLNEGYTELLTDRYFNEQVEFLSYSYEVCKFFAEKLEQIVEKDRMEKFYINADLSGMCKYLTNFDELQHIMSFIVYLDYLVKHASSFNQKKDEPHYELIQCYLAKWYINKKQQELDKNIIDKETYDIEIKNYINSLGNKDLYIENYVKQKEYCLK